MGCDEILAALAAGQVCEQTPSGLKVQTHCLYPSFDQVDVFVVAHGDGFIVTDGGGAVASAWEHGREGLDRVLARASAKFGASTNGSVIEAKVPSADWLKNAILAVANASASAAEAAVERVVQTTEKAIADQILEALARVIPRASIAQDFEHRGQSGKKWRYDFGATANDNLILVNAVAPHHSSISAKYVAFADTPEEAEDISKIAVFGRQLETADVALLQQVATLVPLRSVDRGLRKVLAR